jgi:hypothetical protein
MTTVRTSRSEAGEPRPATAPTSSFAVRYTHVAYRTHAPTTHTHTHKIEPTDCYLCQTGIVMTYPLPKVTQVCRCSSVGLSHRSGRNSSASGPQALRSR